MDFWDRLEAHDPAELARKAERLARILSHLPGSLAYKHRWCLQHVPLLEAEADKEGAVAVTPRSGAIRAMALRYYRHQWKQLDAHALREDRAQQAREAQAAAAKAEDGPLLRLIRTREAV